MYQSIQRFDKNNANTLSIIGAFLSIIGAFLSIIGLFSGNSRIVIIGKNFGIIYNWRGYIYAVAYLRRENLSIRN